MIQLGQGSTGSTEIVFSLAACRTNVRWRKGSSCFNNEVFKKEIIFWI
jgi:hypothetical protein